jgi:hypothetical protein
LVGFTQIFVPGNQQNLPIPNLFLYRCQVAPATKNPDKSLPPITGLRQPLSKMREIFYKPTNFS